MPGIFDDLIPPPETAAGAFDDLIPDPGAVAGAFDDLIPEGDWRDPLVRIRREFPHLPEREQKRMALAEEMRAARAEGRTGFWGGFGEELAESVGQLGRGALQVVPSTLRTAGAVLSAQPQLEVDRLSGAIIPKAPAETAPSPAPEAHPLYRAAEFIEARTDEALPEPEARDLSHDVQRGLGQMGAMLAGGAGLRAAGAGLRGATAGATALGAVQEFDDAFQRARGRGDDPDTALAKALGYSTVAALIENRLGVGRLMRRFYPNAGDAAKKLTSMGVSKALVGNFVAGGAEEGSQRWVQNLIVEGQPSLEGVHEEALPGAIVQGLIGMPGAAVLPAQQSRAARPAGERNVNAELERQINADLARQRAKTPAQAIENLSAAVQDLQAAMTGNQIRPPAGPAAAEPSPGPTAAALADLPAEARAQIERQLADQAIKELTAGTAGATTETGAAAQTITGQNERKGSEAREATTLASQPMPAEGTAPRQPPQSAPRATGATATPATPRPTSPPLTPGRTVYVRLRDNLNKQHRARVAQVQPDGETTVYFTHGPHKGKYQTLKHSLVSEPQSVLTRRQNEAEFAALPETERAQARLDAQEFKELVRLFGPEFGWYNPEAEHGAADTKAGGIAASQALNQGVAKAFAALQLAGEPSSPLARARGVARLREHIGPAAEQHRQARDFNRIVTQGQRTVAEGGHKATARVPEAGLLREGDTFEAQGFQFTVEAVSGEGVQLRDGPKFGEQTVRADEPLHIDKGTLALGPDHEYTPAAVPDAALRGERFSLAELQAREPELDEIARDLYQRPYADLTGYQQGNVQVTLEHEDAREQAEADAAEAEPYHALPAGAAPETAGRFTAPSAGATAAAPARAVPPAPAQTEVQELGEALHAEITALTAERDRLRAGMVTQPHRTELTGDFPTGRVAVGQAQQSSALTGRLDALHELYAAWRQQFEGRRRRGEEVAPAWARATIRDILTSGNPAGGARPGAQVRRARTSAAGQPELRFSLEQAGGQTAGDATAGFRRVEAPDPRTEKARARLEAALRALAGNLGLEAGRVEIVAPTDATERGLAASAVLAKLFGGRLVLFRIDGPLAAKLEGWTAPDGQIFLNVAASRSHLAVTGHELLHRLRLEAPGLYRQLIDAVRPLFGDFAGFEADARRKGYTGDRALMEEELLANLTGDSLLRPDFWARLEQSNPTVFQRAARLVRAWLDQMVTLLRGQGYRSERWFSDLEAARDHLARALGEFTGAQGATALDRASLAPDALRERVTARSERARQVRDQAFDELDRRRAAEKSADRLRATPEEFLTEAEAPQPDAEYYSLDESGRLARQSGSHSPQYLVQLGQQDIPTNHDLGQGRFSLADADAAANALHDEIAAAEGELKAAIRQHMTPPEGMTKAEALRLKNAAAAKLRRLQFSLIQRLTGPNNVDAARSPEQTAELISQTADLFNSVQEEIARLKAAGEGVPSDLHKMRKDLQTRLMVLKGWADDQTEAAAAGQRAERPPQPGSPMRQREHEFEGATNPDHKTFSAFANALVGEFKKLVSPIPELPIGGEAGRRAALFRRGFRLFAAESNRVKREAAERIQQVLAPLAALRTREMNDTWKRYTKLAERLRNANAAGEDARAADVAARMDRLVETLHQDPFQLFRMTVLYRDLWWRGTYLKTEKGKPITLPQGFEPETIARRLAELEARIKAHPDAAAIRQTLKNHYALTDDLQKSILAHGEIIPEALRNPLYFPHHILEYWTGRTDRVRPSTEEDFRRYLIAPVGSGRLIQADYLRAMYVHTADVLAHNARVDLVQQYWQPYDISERLKAEHGEAWDQPRNLPAGYKLFAPFKKLPLRMDYILSREVLADKLGVLFNDGDLRARLGEAGAVLKVAPEDLHAALVAGEKIKWALPVEIADALEGIARREAARSNPGLGHALGWPVRKLVNFWKKLKLFAPMNWPRYEYGNLSTDAVDKVFAADPGAARYLTQAAREVRAAGRGGAMSADYKAAAREGVFETITEMEIQNLENVPEFEHFRTTGQAWRGAARRAVDWTMRGSRFREATFRYAKFLADVDRMRGGKEPVYGGAYHGDIEALGETVEGQRQMLQGDALIYARAAEISLKHFGDYNSLSIYSQWLREYLIPFFSWQDVNFRYHANQLRNMADGMVDAKTILKVSGVMALRRAAAAARVAAMLAAVGIAKELWNQFGVVAAGLADEDDDLENSLSAHDRRRPHLLLGRDRNGEARVAYTPSALGDIMEWVGGQNSKRLALEWLRGQISLEVFVSDLAKQLPGDFVNKLAQSAGPALKVPYELGSGKAVFPDVLNQRTIPRSERWWRALGGMTDDRAVGWLRQVFDQDYYAPGMNEQLQQMILQIRRRDPEQWAYYEAREEAAEWKWQTYGKSKFRGGNEDQDAQVLRNFRRAIYRGDVAAAEQFYGRLLEFGYTAGRFDASIRAQHPLSDLNADQRAAYTAQLAARPRRELELAERYYARIAAFDKREKELFPRNAPPPGSASPGNPELLRRLIQPRR